VRKTPARLRFSPPAWRSLGLHAPSWSPDYMEGYSNWSAPEHRVRVFVRDMQGGRWELGVPLLPIPLFGDLFFCQ